MVHVGDGNKPLIRRNSRPLHWPSLGPPIILHFAPSFHQLVASFTDHSGLLDQHATGQLPLTLRHDPMSMSRVNVTSPTESNLIGLSGVHRVFFMGGTPSICGFTTIQWTLGHRQKTYTSETETLIHSIYNGFFCFKNSFLWKSFYYPPTLIFSHVFLCSYWNPKKKSAFFSALVRYAKCCIIMP